MDFHQFLGGIAAELKELRHRPDHFSVVRFPATSTASCLISIGVGRQSELDNKDEPDEFPIALNNKAPWGNHWNHGGVSSVTLFVQQAPEPVLAIWRRGLGGTSGRQTFLSGLSLCVEDASPDSCFGLLTFLAVVSGVERAVIPERWIAHVDAWERGHTAREPVPIAYGSLHNALVHTKVRTDIRAAWLDGLALLVACLWRDLNPQAIDVEADDTAIARAAANIRYERTTYENIRNALPTLQLEVPLAAESSRRMLVDAVISEERVLMGSHKVDLRADREHSFLGRGYTFGALHRPDAVGTGNDITVSLDPSSGLSLEELWRALETEEDNRWGPDRPNDKPDPRLAAYPGGLRTDAEGRATDKRSPNAPWFHSPDFTLVGAPKRLASGELGSKLSWDEVLDEVWALCNPFRSIQIVATAGNMSLSRAAIDEELCTIEACPNETFQLSSRRVLKCGRWHRPTNAVPALRWSPTLGRYLATCLKRGAGGIRAVKLADVLDAPAHSHLAFRGGIAVVSEDGAFVLANDLGAELKVAEMRAVFEVAAEAMDWIDRNTARVSELMSAVRHHMAGEHVPRLDSHLLIYNEVCSLQLTIVELRHRLDTRTTDRPSQEFSKAIISGWGIEGRLDMLYRDLEEAKAILTAHSELVTNRRIAFLTYFGFPIVLAGGLFSFAFAATARWPPSQENVHWAGLLGFAVFSVLGVLIMLAIKWWDERLSRIRLRDAGFTLGPSGPAGG
ncbi:hypothetical protein [Mesorhizobium escarrei]|uniref:Uncharacterized protein n=1 Tax=Mesorhizobium escarrei TaxID=666018 RepID=A0ABM9E8U6_9HYPH|nr:hypothetical protein [Mesorhizobium escarrei]CAH2405589.1 conserved hypothetical protein [Mesorhizobium escarrei]